jgi:hypothetical protein
MRERLSRAEITKDALQSTVSAGAETVAEVTTVVVHAVRDVVNAVGGFATEVFEIREAARRARVESGLVEGDVPAAIEELDEEE